MGGEDVINDYCSTLKNDLDLQENSVPLSEPPINTVAMMNSTEKGNMFF